MIKKLIKPIVATLIIIALYYLIYRLVMELFVSQPVSIVFHPASEPFMLSGDHYHILPVCFIAGTMFLYYLFFNRSGIAKRKLLFISFVFGIVSMLLFTAIYALTTAPTYYFMFSWRLGVHVFCWLLVGILMQNAGFFLWKREAR